MSKKVILFDLDGTLLPMEQSEFVNAYFGGLAKNLSKFGYEPETLINSVLAGTSAMIKNPGNTTNEEVFWNKMSEIYGEKVRKDIQHFDHYYETEFDKVKETCGFNPEVPAFISTIKGMGFRMALATNPLFPPIATHKRITWAGLTPDIFELITTYDNSIHSKPNPEYYKDILSTLDITADECLMVGNDVTEDMVARELGIDVFLLTDNLINKDNIDISIYPSGKLDDLLTYIENLV